MACEFDLAVARGALLKMHTGKLRSQANFGDSHGLGRGGVFSVFFDREGSIWIGRDKRLSILKRGSPKFEDLPVSVHYITSMAQSRTGEIWVSDAWRTVHALSDTTPQGALHREKPRC